MNNQCGIFVRKTTHFIWLSIFFAYALFESVNGSVEGFSFPARKFLPNQGECNHPGTREAYVEGVSRSQEGFADRVNQDVPFFSSIPSDSKAITDKIANKSCCESEHQDLYGVHSCFLIYLLICFLGGFVIGYFKRVFWDWLAYSPTVESIFNFFYKLFDNTRKIKKKDIPSFPLGE